MFIVVHIQRENFAETADSLSRSVTAPAFSILGCYEKAAHLGWLLLPKMYAADLSEALSDVQQYF